MRRSLVLLAATTVAIVTSRCSGSKSHHASLKSSRLPQNDVPPFLSDGQSRRFLEEDGADEDGGGSGYRYINDVSGYHMEFGKCVRVKIPQNNDDDAEGNSYFVNGRYHAFYQNFASFYLCDDCGSCDYSIEYVTDLETYLEASTNYIQGYCNSCAANCRRRLRKLEDEEEDGGGGGNNYASLDCSTCQSQCQDLNSNNNDDAAAADETQYLECQAGPQGDDGLQYYSAPQCGSTSNIIIGLYYDEDCTVKTSQELDYGFSYSTFNTITSTCVDCQDGLCANLYDQALHCSDGYNQNQNANNDGDMPICRTYKSMEDKQYSARSKQLKFMPLVIALVVLGVFALFGAYTYYVRHKNPLAEPLSSNPSGTPAGGTPTDLPPIT